MKKLLTQILFFIIISASLFSRETEEQRPKTDANVFGHVVDAETGEHLPFVTVMIEGTRIGTITDASGHYLLTNLPLGDQVIVVQSVGYQRTYLKVFLEKDKSIEVDIDLQPVQVSLAEIVITSSPTASGFRYQPDRSFLGEELQRKSEASFGEMLNRESGLSMRSMGSAPTRPVIRGLDGERILVLQNGERMGDISETSADHSISLDPLAASRIEVVRGPASLLYGSSALGGVVNIFTPDIPDEVGNETSGVFSLQGATVNNMMAGFGRITTGNPNWAATARISYRNAGDINTPIGRIPGTKMNNIDAAVGMALKGGQSTGGVSLSFTNQNYGIPVFDFDDDERVEIRMQRLSAQGRFNFSSSGFFDKSQLRFNLSRMYQDEVEIEDDEEEIELSFLKYSLSSTFTMQHKPFSFFDRGAVGFNVVAHDMDVSGDEAFSPGERKIGIGVFSFQEIPLDNTFRLQAGIRFDAQYTGALPNEIFPTISQSRTTFNYSGSLGFNHRPLSGWEIGGQLARSYRNPNVQELYSDGVHLGAGVYEIGNPLLKDEIGNGGDLFVKYSGKHLEAELAVFHNRFQNYIIFAPTGDFDQQSGFPVFNYEKDLASIGGGELFVSWSPSRIIKASGGVDYVRGQRISNGTEPLPFMPPLRFKPTLEFDFGPAWFNVNALVASTQNRVAPDEEPTDGYWLLGASAGVRINKGGRHVVIIKADNILDTSYRDHLSRLENRNFLMPGRNISLTYRWFF
jgi:iron complex outermembrane receptor protein